MPWTILTNRIDVSDVVDEVPPTKVDGDLAVGGALLEDSAGEIIHQL